MKRLKVRLPLVEDGILLSKLVAYSSKLVSPIHDHDGNHVDDDNSDNDGCGWADEHNDHDPEDNDDDDDFHDYDDDVSVHDDDDGDDDRFQDCLTFECDKELFSLLK